MDIDALIQMLNVRLPSHGPMNQTHLILNAAVDWLEASEASQSLPFVIRLVKEALKKLPLVPLAKVVNRASEHLGQPLDRWPEISSSRVLAALEETRSVITDEVEETATRLNAWAARQEKVVMCGGLDAEVEQALRKGEATRCKVLVLEPTGLDEQGYQRLTSFLSSVHNAWVIGLDRIHEAMQWACGLLLGNTISSTGFLYGNPSISVAVDMAFPRVRDVALLMPTLRRLYPTDHFTFRQQRNFCNVGAETAARVIISERGLESEKIIAAGAE